MTCDIRQFFPSIDHEILRDVIASDLREAIFTDNRRLLRREEHPPRNDMDVMWLIDKILQSGAGVLAEEYEMIYFPGDDLFSINRPRGLPIGNLTSQFWANCYLDRFDHFVKRELACKGYVRYVDDFLLFSTHWSEFIEWRKIVMQRLMEFRLTIHKNNTQIRPVMEGIPFLEFTIFPTHRRLKRRKGISFQRKYKRLLLENARGNVMRDQITASVQGWINHVRYGNTWGLRRSILTMPQSPVSNL